MRRNLQRWWIGSLTVVVMATAAGCPQKPVGIASDAGATETILTRVGSGSLYVLPGDAITLRALLVDSNGVDTPKPIADTTVTWSLVQVPSANSVTFSSKTATTDSTGVAQTTVTIASDFTAGVKIVLRADAPGATSSAIWDIDVNPLGKLIQIIPNPPLISLTDSTGDKAAVAGVVGTTAVLQIRLFSVTTGTGGMVTHTPLANDTVTYSFSAQCGSPSFVGSTTPQTDSGGNASVTLAMGPTGGTNCRDTVVVTDGNVFATFDVTVSEMPPPCTSSSSCGVGWACIGGECQQQSAPSLGSCTGSDLGCPIGYTCTSGACTPVTGSSCGTCPANEVCNDTTMMCEPGNPQCTTNTDCPGGTCQNGTCIPNSNSVINVTGNWYTQHEFDIQSALPSWVQDLGTGVRVIDQILQGQISGLPSIINDLIQGLVQEYVPSWVTTIVYVLDNAFTVFSNLRAAGEMSLAAVGGNYAVIQGQEYWDHFIFYLLSQCGGNISGNPTVPPPCAAVDVYTSELNAANLSTTVNPFTGSVSGPIDAAGDYTFFVNTRTVDLELQGILLYVINQVIATTTGYPSLQGPPGDPQDGALYNLIDCAGLGQLADSILPGLDSVVTAACQAAVEVAADALANELNNITISGDVLSFSGSATAQPTPGNVTYAGQLGYSDNLNFTSPHTPADGVWSATFGQILGDVPGRWYASRQPIPNPTQ